MPNTFTLQVNRRDPRPRSPRLRSLGSGSTSGSAMPGGQIPADIAQQISAAIAALTERIASAYLSKLHDDVAAGRITFEQGLRALQTVNIEAADLVITSGEDGGGNIEADGDISAGGDISASGDLDVSGAAVIGGNLTAGGFTGSPSFATGLLGHGWRIGGPNNNGHGELDSLTLRKFLEVPELRYNRTEVHVGVDWHTHGAGLIEEVAQITETTGIIKLKLEDGEIGAIAKDDYCMGIFHNENPGETNATDNADMHNGNFTFAGFQTVYFKVVDICDENGDTENPDSRNQYFLYELRPVTESDEEQEGEQEPDLTAWSELNHPQPSMSFACYANPNNSERQSCVYATTDYIIMLVGMTDWTYDGDNIAYIRGNLNGFTIPERHLVNGEWVDTEQYKTLSGYGIAFGKAYMWGEIEQFNRKPFLMTQQLHQMVTDDTPDVVLNDSGWRAHYTWVEGPLSPTPAAPYLYSFWEQTFSDGSTNIEGPWLSGYDNSIFTVVLNKEVVSLALSDWFVDGSSSDTLQFDVDAKLLRGKEQIAATDATASSAINGFGYSKTIDQYGIVHFHVTITGFVPQQVERVLAENNFVTFRLYSGDNYAEHTLTIAENRQGDEGEDGDDAINYVLEASTSTFSHTNTVPFDVHAYRLSQEKVLTLMFIVRADFDANNGLVWGSCSQVHTFVDVTPRGDTTHSIRFYAFFNSDDAVKYLRYLGGNIQYSEITADPVCTLAVNLAEPVISFQLSHEGTLTYPVDASTRRPNEISFTIKAHFFINSVDVPLTAISCTPLSASSGISLATCELDASHRGYCDFESIDSEAAPTSPQIYTITASAVYGGVTYTMHKDISFSAVTAGTSVQGPQGLQGCVVRLRGEWDESIEYVNQSTLDETNQTVIAQGKIRYIDVVQYAVNGTTKWYQRNTYRTDYGMVDAGSGQITYRPPTNSDYWTECSSFEFIATQLLLAQNAQITFGQGNQILIMAEDGQTIVGGLTGFDINNPSAYRLWLGAQQPAEAPFSVTHQGALVAANINARFQDLSSCHSAGAQQSQDDNEHYRKALYLDDIKNGTPVRDSNENQVAVLPRVYNIIANFCLVQLPTSSDYIGTRVLICNNDGSFGTGTVVVQQGRDSFYGTPLLEVGTRTVPIISTPVTVIEFVGGVMEFIAVPHSYDSSKCTWALLSDASNIKYYNGEIQNFNFPDEE